MESTKKYNHEYVKYDERHVVYLKEFIIYEQADKDKYAIFKFFNNYIEELNHIEFLIKQYDIDGVLIAENTLKYSNFKADKKSEFSPYTKLMVEDECHRVEAVLVNATFSKHYFEDNKLSTLKDVENMKRGLKPSRKERNKVRTKKIKNKNKIRYFLLAPFLAVALGLSLILTWNSVEEFASNLTQVSDENFHYTIINGKATVDKYFNSDKDVTIVSDIYGYEVTKIKRGLFENTSVETVTIRAKEIEIGENAFRNCQSLEKVSCNKVTSVGDYAFSGCEKLTAFNFKKTEEIGKYAFANTSIEKVESDTLTLIGDGAFENCNEITKIDVINASVGNNAFSNNLVIEEISIGDFSGSIGNVFGISTEELKEHFKVINCKPLTIENGDFIGLDFASPTINIDFSIASIDYHSMVKYFEYKGIECIDTGNAEIVNNVLISLKNKMVTNLSNHLVSGYTVTSISPGVIASIANDNLIIDIDGVTLNENTFVRTNLTKLEIGDGVLVDNDAFGKNDTILELTIHANENNNYSKVLKDVKNLSKINFRGSFVPEGCFEGLTQLNTIEFNEPVKIYANAFKGCKNLANIDFSYIEEIGNSAFSGCEAIYKIPFNPGTRVIGKDAFKDCINLSDINSLPENAVVNKAFTGKNNITYLEIFNYETSISDIGDFDKLEKLVIKSNPLYYQSLCSNLVSDLDNLKTLELPEAVFYESNIVNNCKKLKFITLYSNSSVSSFIGNGCDSLYYVTINGNINVPYKTFNRSSDKTKNLYINGVAEPSFDLVDVNNINYIKIEYTNALFIGELFGASTYKEQAECVPASLKTVELGNSSVQAYFFYGCSYIHNVILPNATSINTSSLSKMNSIRNIYFGSNSLSSTSFVNGFNEDEHLYTPNILGNSFVLQNLKSSLENVNYININGNKVYNVYSNEGIVGEYEGVLIYSIDEILDRYDLSGSLSFSKNSNVPVNVDYYSSENRLYVFEPQEVTYKANYSKPVTINYHYLDENGFESVKTVNYNTETNESIEYFVPESYYLFAGWYTNQELTDRFDFEANKTISSNLDLYAKQIIKNDKIYTESSIDSFSNNASFYSLENCTVEIFIYGQAGVTFEIDGKTYNVNEELELNIQAHRLYEITINSNYHYNISIIFGSGNKLQSNIKVNVSNKSFKNFKLSGSFISNYDIPKVDGYELVGWYDSKGNLVIDKYGNVYKYSDTEVYARWEYITE